MKKIEKAIYRASYYFMGSRPEAEWLAALAFKVHSSTGDIMVIYRYVKSHSRDFRKEVPKHYKSMYQRAYNRTGNADEAKDIVQSSIVKAINYYDKTGWKPSGKDYDRDLSAWLCRIVENEFTSKKRRDKVRQSSEIKEMDASDDTADGYTLEIELKNKINSLITPKEKLILEYKHFDNKSFQWISEHLNIPVNEVRNLFYSAGSKIRMDNDVRRLMGVKR